MRTVAIPVSAVKIRAYVFSASWIKRKLKMMSRLNTGLVVALVVWALASSVSAFV